MNIKFDFIKVAETHFDFEFSLNKKLSIKEQKLLVQILNAFIKKGEGKVFLSTSKVKDLLMLKEDKEVFFLLDKLIKNDICIDSYKSQNLVSRVKFVMISTYEVFDDDSFAIELSKEFLKTYNNNSVYNKISLDMIVRFRNKYTPVFFHNFIIKLRDVRKFEVEVESLKELLKIEDIYDRTFDFEKRVLKGVIEEINSLTPYKINYNKNYKGKKLKSFEFILKEIDKSKIFDTSKLREEKDKYKVIFEEYAKVKNLFAIESLIFSKFARLKFSYNVYTELSDALSKLEEEKIIVFEHKDIRLLVEYNPNDKSLIRIYEKE